MQIILSSRNNEYIGILLNHNLLVANTLPATTKSTVLNELQRYTQNAVVHVIDADHPITDALWAIWYGVDYPPIDLAFDFTGYTSKEVRVLRQLIKISPGETITYGELAKKVGIPNGARFVGNVMAKNRWPLIIPCHRVVRKDGIGNYSSRENGPEIKKRLLEQEKRYKEKLAHSSF